MAGGWGPVRQVLQTSDDRIGTELPGEATGMGLMPGVREGPSEGFTGYPPQKPARRRERGGTAEGRRGIWRRGNDIRTFRMMFPEKAGPRPCPVEGCSGRAATRTSTRVNLCQRHVRYTVVILEEGNPPPPMVPSVRHAGAMEGSEWDTSVHHLMKEGGGAKETAPDSGGGEGGHLQDLQRVWMPPGYGDLIKILGAGDFSGGR